MPVYAEIIKGRKKCLDLKTMSTSCPASIFYMKPYVFFDENSSQKFPDPKVFTKVLAPELLS